ncbi:MAG: hypothetical protein ABSE70_01495 [Candidatus Limnocylindrales bacterium]
MPEITGLTASLAAGKVTYAALAGNTYKLNAGAYAGVFNPFVSVKKEQVGGVTLEPVVVSKLIADSLVSISAQTDKYMAALPLDVRTVTAATALNIDYVKGYGGAIPIVLISFNGELPVTNILPDTKQVLVAANTFTGWIYAWPLRLDAKYVTNIYPGKEEYYLTVGGQFEGFTASNTGTTVNAPFGGRICDTTEPVSITEGAGQEWRDMNPDHVLMVPGSNVPVFVATG